ADEVGSVSRQPTMLLADRVYALPAELIAQEPAPERTAARLLVLDRSRETLAHSSIAELPAHLRRGGLLGANDAPVVPARVRGRRPGGGRPGVLFRRPGAGGVWGRRLLGAPGAGERVHRGDARGEWVGAHGDGRWQLRMLLDEPVLGWLERTGEVPLPPYIRRPTGPTAVDRERYQTLHARVPGAVAAPTAGLHL